MKRQSIFRPNGWDRLEVRITPSTIGHAPAADMVRIDAHVQGANVHPSLEVHDFRHKVQHPAKHNGHPVNRQGGSVGGVILGPVTLGSLGAIGLGSTGSGIMGGGSGGLKERNLKSLFAR